VEVGSSPADTRVIPDQHCAETERKIEVVLKLMVEESHKPASYFLSRNLKVLDER
jgi:hypothetical protein